ncbi:MAG: Dihydroorotate dehydrogenase electron transfer subunit [Firmicutes bacterium]|nr:Dihydroorotate dehydrogenase electron transfer subunit [Bacillota bacterium]
MTLPKTIVKAEVLAHKLIGPEVCELTLKASGLVQMARPGQFVHVRVADTIVPLLRRPISIADANAAAGTLTLIYRIVGHGTELLAQTLPGSRLDLMGPLGNGFVLEAERPLLVGGGIGLAPLVYLAKALCTSPITIVMGGRNKNEMYWQDIFQSICQNIHITTDDGSMGRQGFTVDVIDDILTGDSFDMVYACGPRPMLEGVARLAKERNVRCQVSLEDHMACGVGACLSCTCAATDGKRRKVCTDGPVFWAEEVFD